MSKSLKDIPIKVIPPDQGTPEMEDIILYEAHKKVYPRWTNGIFTRWRWFWVIATQVFFYGMPWLMLHDRQMLLFDLVHRRFFIFGMVFLPGDFIYLTSLLLSSAFGLFVWTSVGGRLWCGYACPQSVYTEVFLWIEKWVEGDRPARIKLDKEAMSARKFRIKATKHALWLVLALWTGFTFVGYFTPIRELAGEVFSSSLGPWETFWILFYAFATWGNAGFMREQVCKYMCPYARFQSAMFDPDTLIISYDTKRGEPRGSRRKGEDWQAAGKGACVDCTLCVQVCPVGIDIRNGLQYECIACGACIDACDSIMDKLEYPRGLVRYTTENALNGKYDEKDILKHVFRPRVLLYSTVLIAVMTAAGVSLYKRIPLSVNISRDRGALVRETDSGLLENTYRVQIQNVDEKAHRYVIRVEGITGINMLSDAPNEIVIPGNNTQMVGLRLQADPANVQKGANKLVIHVDSLDAPDIHASDKATFMGR
ncbi:cytochrome c oxidase accessory protein CcoG [Burkholderiaceae bacterium DAT-1]|nr:cytochrome c oxidase accessory protein CcoG [Burkholderiaceae bacterium DAT-1]